MNAKQLDGEWVVIDDAGGTWTPSDEAAAEIAAAADTAKAAVEMCQSSPMRGTWQN